MSKIVKQTKSRINTKTTLRDNGSLRVQTIDTLPSKTQQQFKDQCDINRIMRKYNMRQLPDPSLGMYLDTTDAPTYQKSLEVIINANNSFAALNSEIRKRFHNDPTELLQFLKDPKNTEEAIKLGLATKKQTEIKTDTKINNEQNDEKIISENKK